jgi:hypothetical protein
MVYSRSADNQLGRILGKATSEYNRSHCNLGDLQFERDFQAGTPLRVFQSKQGMPIEEVRVAEGEMLSVA